MNPLGFRQARGPKKGVFTDGPKDVVHENTFTTLEHVLTSFMVLIALSKNGRYLTLSMDVANLET